jgi:hypothetical protein
MLGFFLPSISTVSFLFLSRPPHGLLPGTLKAAAVPDQAAKAAFQRKPSAFRLTGALRPGL